MLLRTAVLRMVVLPCSAFSASAKAAIPLGAMMPAAASTRSLAAAAAAAAGVTAAMAGEIKRRMVVAAALNALFAISPATLLRTAGRSIRKAPNKRGKATSAAANGGGKRKAESEPKKSGKSKKKKSKNVKFGNQSYDSDSSMS